MNGAWHPDALLHLLNLCDSVTQRHASGEIE
jgi:hypothetical protein